MEKTYSNKHLKYINVYIPVYNENVAFYYSNIFMQRKRGRGNLYVYLMANNEYIKYQNASAWRPEKFHYRNRKWRFYLPWILKYTLECSLHSRFYFISFHWRYKKYCNKIQLYLYMYFYFQKKISDNIFYIKIFLFKKNSIERDIL